MVLNYLGINQRVTADIDIDSTICVMISVGLLEVRNKFEGSRQYNTVFRICKWHN